MDALRRRTRLKIVLSTVCLLAFALGYGLTQTGVQEVRTIFPAEQISSNGKTIGNEIALVRPSPHDCPWWRGSDSNNVFAEAQVPLRWTLSENVHWRTSIPGQGHSSPCVWGDQIFLTTSQSALEAISLVCLSRLTGKIQWQSELHRGGLNPIHVKNTHASSTPACDGSRVFVCAAVAGSLHVTAVDFQGKAVWNQIAGPYVSEWGYGSSPVIYKSFIVVAGDNRGHQVDRLLGTSWLTALDRHTGRIIWRVERPTGDSFGSPVLGHIAGRDQLVHAGKEAVFSYRPETGDVLWKCRWKVGRTANTVAFDTNCVYATGKHRSAETLCIRADGQGDVTDTHVVWREPKSACDVPALCVHQGRLYSWNDQGVLTCLDVATGKILWKRRLGGNAFASPLIAGSNLICANEAGNTFVVSLQNQGQTVLENTLTEGIYSSPVVSRDQIFLRTVHALYCLGNKTTVSIAGQPGSENQRQ